MDPRVLYVGHITHCDENDLRDFFSKWGELRSVWVARQPPGFGYVTFEDPTDAQRALFEGQGQEINGELIKLENAKPRRRVRYIDERSYHHSRSRSRSRGRRHRHHSRSSSRSRSRNHSRRHHRRHHRHHSSSESRSRSASRSHSRSDKDDTRRERSRSISKHDASDRSSRDRSRSLLSDRSSLSR